MEIAEEVLEQGPWVMDTSNFQLDIVSYGLPLLMARYISLLGKSWLLEY